MGIEKLNGLDLPVKEAKKLRIHVLGVPHTKTTLDYTGCAYTMKVWKFCKMMKARGHFIMHYGHEESNPDANENISVINKKEFDEVYLDTHKLNGKVNKYSNDDKAYTTFFKNAIREIRKRKLPGDIILPFWGHGVRPICDAHPDLTIIEPGIGYGSDHFANFKVFESYAILHAYGGLPKMLNADPSFYDVVIPNYFDLSEFKYSDKKEDYFLFLGRVCWGKGLGIAIQVTKAIGAKLKVAGQLFDEYASKGYEWPDHVEYVGYVGVDPRKKLMKGAIASFIPSLYNEPFGGVQIENLLSGTPTITTDFGAFTENNIEGVTGYRCTTFEDFVKAAINCKNGKIKSKDCRNHGEKFSLENIAPKYEKFFNDALNVKYGQGWYEMSDTSLYTKEWVSNHLMEVIFPNDNHVNIKIPEHQYSRIFRDRCTAEPMFRKIHTHLFKNKIINGNIIDGGSWIGDNSIPWALLNPGSILYSIDPSKNNLDFQNLIAKTNNIKNLITINTVLSDNNIPVYSSSDEFHMSFNKQEGKPSIDPHAKGKELLFATCSIDELLDKGDIADVGYIHLDVEGFELNVIKGSLKTIKKYKPIITFEQHLESNDYLRLSSLIKNYGYKVYQINEKITGSSDCRNFIAFPIELNVNVSTIESDLNEMRLFSKM
tara:strand:+ start:52 stop:2019 length:1968 start_codon:yes stop_codon:yes gene_type:complete